ncbi:MAG TPA: A/G-specific adenine glycosylase, partial [Candidatus Paceibacterota bacterium]|nr:A/G-specific adenine glycosylase [Candidatus Paceibacterota bacterium]
MSSFPHVVWAYYKKYGRHTLPWRTTHNAYRILVSEVMLQQTQVDRVVPLYKNFIQKFPTARKLAEAPLSDVLKNWQGLGYNRRAKMVHEAARKIAREGMPKDVAGLEALSGVGPYTARAVAAFAYNQDVILIETNIRTVIMHHFFSKKKKVSDTEIEKILVRVFPKGKSRAWYSALMDYGAYLKRSGITLNTKQLKYLKQGKFSGSNREARAAILRFLASETSASKASLVMMLGTARHSQMREALAALQKEGLVIKSGATYTLA